MSLRPLLLLPFLALLFGCRKDSLFTDDPSAKLTFAMDTILFDTVFTSDPGHPELPSVTKRFTVHNTHANAVRVRVTLEGGNPSPFRINVDGASGADHEVELLGKDSLYVFVECTVDPNNAGNPMVVEDRILFRTNGNEQHVQLVAWGQDVHRYYNIEGSNYSLIAGGLDPFGNPICETVEWHNDKPYLIYGRAAVDSCSKLIVHPGVRVYFHGGAGMWIYKYGNIEARGTAEDPITFQGDRKEAMYQDLPGQWDRIWVWEGDADNVFEHCRIKNALVGIQCETDPRYPGAPDAQNQIVLDNVSIRNCSAAGILSRNYRIRSTNLLVANAGQYAMVLLGGGQYQFNHTTVANYWSYDIRQEPSFYLSNQVGTEIGTLTRDIRPSLFQNLIVHGNNTTEFELALSGGTNDLTFQYCLLRTGTGGALPTAYFPDPSTIWRNQNPGFRSAGDGNFRLAENAFARNRGLSTTDPVAFLDLDGMDRFWDGLPDLGCYEWYPQ